MTSGIRQGCTCSPWLFVMMMNQIIEKVIDTKIGFRNEKYKIPILMFADDGLLLAHSIGNMRVLIRTLNEIATELGMKINKNKSTVLLFNSDNEIMEIEGIEVGDNMRYLGVVINSNKNYLGMHKEKKIKMAKLHSNLTYSVIHKSCNKVTIGKTYWENVILPSVLFGSSVITLSLIHI